MSVTKETVRIRKMKKRHMKMLEERGRRICVRLEMKSSVQRRRELQDIKYCSLMLILQPNIIVTGGMLKNLTLKINISMNY